MEDVAGDLPTLVTTLMLAFILVLVMRWVFKPSRPHSGRAPDASASTELGLLEVVATSLDRREAMNVRAALGEATIRTSLSTRRDGKFDVLVFRADADRAHQILHPV
ncbi:hypothetical protein SAMN05444157_2716 [Frankineae bacterium MT45]|nr:hypothetical protein SAMN05444157_2716 [Frankineae bacterium MT45]